MPANSMPPTTEKPAAARVWARMVGVAVDRPTVVATILTGLVATHAVLASRWEWLSPYKAMVRAESISTTVTIYLITAAAAALVASLAGVIIVFVISAQTPQVRVFRREAGPELRRTWIAVVAEPFVATFLGVIAAVTQTTAGGRVAPWMFELAVVLLAHSSLRLVLLLRELVAIVASDDDVFEQEANIVSKADIFGVTN